MDRVRFAEEFRELLEARSDVETHGCSSEKGRGCLEGTRAPLREADPRRGGQFEKTAELTTLPAPSESRRPLWTNVFAIPEGVFAAVEHSRSTPRWDFFICHASEDKGKVVEPLARELVERGFRVWYDRWELTVGDSLRESIDRGLSDSRFGIVVLSPSFLGKAWPRWELNGLIQRERGGQKVILPVWHDVTHEEVARYSPLLADRVAGSTRQGIPTLADRLAREVADSPGPQRAGEAFTFDTDIGREKRGEVLEAISAFRATINSLCGGFSPTADGWLKLDGELAEANAEVRRRLDKNSPWLDRRWVEAVERLEDLGLRIATEFRYQQARAAVTSDHASSEVMSWCDEFKALFQTLRTGSVQ